MDYRGVEEEVGGSSSRRVSQEFKKLYNIFEQNSPSISPTGRLSFSSISTNGRVGSVRKVKKSEENSKCTHTRFCWTNFNFNFNFNFNNNLQFRK